MATIAAKHPLQTEWVIDIVFKYLELHEIIQQRLVCKSWYMIGTRLLVDRIDEVEIKFGCNFSWDVPNPRKTIENFLRMQESCPVKFTNFATYYFESNLNGKIPSAEETAKLFHLYGRHMKKIKLNLSGKNCWRFLSDILMTHAPNVEELYLDGYPDERIIQKKLFPQKMPELKLKAIILHSEDEYEDPIYSRELLTDIFRSSPHLESLVIGLDSDQIMEDRENSHESLVLLTLANEGNISNLKHLSLGDCTEEEFEILAEYYKRAPLRELNAPITQIYSEDMLEFIETFLKDHKDTWTELRFSFPCVDICMPGINFPKMVNLTLLSISEWCMNEEELDEGHSPLKVFNFGRQFPNLVTLKLIEDPKTDGRSFFNLEELFPEQAPPILSLRNLTLPPQIQASILRRIERIFPNVTNLTLTVQTVEVLNELWITWPELKQLDIAIVAAVSFGSNSLDSIFTGIPNASLETLDNCRTNPVAVKSSSYIGRLKKLTHLLIKGPERSGLYKVNKSFNAGLKLTDKTARLALANLKELVFLRISSDRHEISSSCVQSLSNALDLHQVNDNCGALRLVKYQWQEKIRVYDF